MVVVRCDVLVQHLVALAVGVPIMLPLACLLFLLERSDVSLADRLAQRRVTSQELVAAATRGGILLLVALVGGLGAEH